MNLSLQKSTILIWPIEAFVTLADDAGHVSIGNAIMLMSWLAPRKQDWLEWPPDVFNSDMLAPSQEKTDVPNVIPWRMADARVKRVEPAKARPPIERCRCLQRLA